MKNDYYQPRKKTTKPPTIKNIKEVNKTLYKDG